MRAQLVKGCAKNLLFFGEIVYNNLWLIHKNKGDLK